MVDETDSERPFEYTRLFPWLYLARALRMAVDPRKLLLAGLALLLITGLDAGYNRLRFGEGGPTLADNIRERAALARELAGEPEPKRSPTEIEKDRIRDRGYLIASRWPWRTTSTVEWLDPSALAGSAANTVAAPWVTVVEPIAIFVEPVGFLHRCYLVIRLIWALVVWGVVAGAITRMTALEFARDERIGTVSAIRYASGRLVSFVGAPVIPLVLIGILAGLCLLGGLVGQIPIVGPLFAGVLWFLPLLAGFVMSLVAVGAVLGWPLMYATISTQDSDAFDGFSRSYTFVFSRPWYYALLLVVAFLLATVGVAVVQFFALLTTEFAQQSVALGMSAEKVDDLFAVAGEGSSGTWAALFWQRLLLLLATGFGASFFWVAATLSYFLLRRADDGTALDEVETEFDDHPDDLGPLAGVAASPQPAEARPVVELSTADKESDGGADG